MSQPSRPVPYPEIDPKLPQPESGGSSTGMAGLRPGTVSELWADDAAHPKRAPGAYEWWNFDCFDTAGNGVILAFYDGFPFHPQYLAQVRSWYRGRRPKLPRPEMLAAHYPAAYMAVYQGGRRVAQFLNLYPPGSFESAADSPELRVGPNRLTLRADGSFGLVARGYPFEIRNGTPHPRTDLILSAALSFVPTLPGVQHVRPFRPLGPDGADHKWVLAAPHCQVTGRLRLLDDENTALLDLPLNTRGYHDHNFGHGSLGLGVKRFSWGHAVGDTWTLVWQRSHPADDKAPRHDAIMLFEKDQRPIVIDAPEIVNDRYHATRWLLRYPSHTAAHGSDAKGNPVELLLNHHDVIETSPFHLHLATSATLNIPGRRSYSASGLTNIVQPDRLRWPLLSDVTLAAILSLSADDPLWRQ